MNYTLSVIFIVAGIIMLVMGLMSADSLASQFTRFFSGHPTDKAMWLLIGGVTSLLIGTGWGYSRMRS
jgi:hypothetical protein